MVLDFTAENQTGSWQIERPWKNTEVIWNIEKNTSIHIFPDLNIGRKRKVKTGRKLSTRKRNHRRYQHNTKNRSDPRDNRHGQRITPDFLRDAVKTSEYAINMKNTE